MSKGERLKFLVSRSLIVGSTFVFFSLDASGIAERFKLFSITVTDLVKIEFN